MSIKVSGRQYSDVLVAFFVLCIASLLLVPLPTALLDILIAFNIAFSLLLLLIGLSLNNALSLLVFPALLLLTTLFRLSLNVASTRLILSQGDAGTVIRSFGTFLIRGEIAVGVIIFMIITIVNFIVIARGASRISEVAARFVLDALPGKQMAIDSDLRVGLISAEQAKQKREELRKETQLYGSMDGAMKFVQGDVIAGIFIIFTNIFGGIYMGLKQGMSFSEAFQVYTTLTVGDGLVTQIPALLVSICAGVIVTRVSSGVGATLGSDLISQLFTNRKVLLLAALVTILISLFPGLPVLPFAFIAGTFVLAAYLFSGEDVRVLERRVRPIKAASIISSQAATHTLEYLSPLKVKLSSDLYSLYQARQNFYLSWWQGEQERFATDYKLQLPQVVFLTQNNLPFKSWQIFVNDYEIKSGQISKNSLILPIPAIYLKSFGIKSLKTLINPLNNLPASLVKRTPFIDDLSIKNNLQLMDPLQYICMQASNFYINNPEEIVSLTAIHSRLKEIENHHPGLFAGLFENNFINPARLVEVQKTLYKSGFYLSDLKILLEKISLYASTEGVELVKSGEFVIGDIVDFIRKSEKRLLLGRYLGENRGLPVILISEDNIKNIISFPRSSARDKKQLLESFENVYDALIEQAVAKVVLLVPDGLRFKTENFCSALEHHVVCISISELDTGISVEPVGIW